MRPKSMRLSARKTDLPAVAAMAPSISFSAPLMLGRPSGRDVARTNAPRIDAPDLAALTENPLAPRAGVTFALWFAKSEVHDARDQLRAIYAQTLNLNPPPSTWPEKGHFNFALTRVWMVGVTGPRIVEPGLPFLECSAYTGKAVGDRLRTLLPRLLLSANKAS